MNTQALVSIAMATYNGDEFLKEQLDSIYAQSYKNIEVIVCDDCSSDKTIEILKMYEIKYGLKYYMNEQNLGYVKNFERAINLCNGDYIALADQDDIWLENKIEFLLANIEDNLLIHSDCELIDENGQTISKTWKNELKSHKVFEDFLFSNVATGCTIMFKKKLLERILPFPEGLTYHDWYLSINAAKDNKIVYINKPLIKYRQHINQNTSAYIEGKFQALIINKILRFKGNTIRRQTIYETQVKNLYALKSMYLNFDNEKITKIDEAIIYFENYLNSLIHFKTFLIGCKNSSHIYFNKNPFFIKNIINDIIG
ncbi:MAG: glycosyltransferase family 2 protein [Thiovulaceae bacterium]|nr:glycosyltransferase family 2 protein [Sulfurimonadaceae bacterium]